MVFGFFGVTILETVSCAMSATIKHNMIAEPNFTIFEFFLEIPGKKKAYTALLQCRTFLCRKKWGPQRKDFGGGYGFPDFYRVFVSTTGLESFSFRPEKFSKIFSFGGGCVRFFSSL